MGRHYTVSYIEVHRVSQLLNSGQVLPLTEGKGYLVMISSCMVTHNLVCIRVLPKDISQRSNLHLQNPFKEPI